MYELCRTGERTYYVNSPAKAGVVLEDEGAYLIDSGNDKEAGKKLLKILNANSWELKGIINTHSNADHIGGNKYLQDQTGCKVFSSGIEKAFTEYPVLEPSFLYGGYPCGELRHKFLLARPSDVTDISDSSFPKDIEVIPLPGHFFNMTGFRTADGTVFLADCLSSAETLEKYGISFIYDVAGYLKTLEFIQTVDGEYFVPAHAPAAKDITELAGLNISKVNETAELIVTLCSGGISFEKLLQKLFAHYDLTMNFEQYVLVGSTLRSYLSWLHDSGRITVDFDDNMLIWKS